MQAGLWRAKSSSRGSFGIYAATMRPAMESIFHNV
jgi:hypothetical protein